MTPKTKAVMFSHVVSGFGTRMPARELCSMIRDRGALALVDGAQAVGQMEVDVKALGCDAYVASPHKWMMAPKGTGFLYIRRDLQDRFWTTLASSHWDDHESGAFRFMQYGTGSVPVHEGLAAAVAFIHKIGMPRIERWDTMLTKRLRDGLAMIPSARITSPTDPRLASAITTFRIEGVKARALQEALWTRRRFVYVHRATCAAYGCRPTSIWLRRTSTQCWTWRPNYAPRRRRSVYSLDQTKRSRSFECGSSRSRRRSRIGRRLAWVSSSTSTHTTAASASTARNCSRPRSDHRIRSIGSTPTAVGSKPHATRYADSRAIRTPLADAKKKGLLVASSDAYWFAPVPRPGKVVCIGLNYRDHAEESGLPLPKMPVVFSKFSSCVIAPGEPIVIPPTSEKVDYEAELAVVIGRRASRVKADRAYDYVLGYTAFNDVSARDFQFGDGQWQRGKSCDTFAPMGQAIVTTDEIPDPHTLRITLKLNGALMQDSNTSQLIFKVPELIEFITASITLEPGDVIATGTPAGVGFARKPPVFLKAGDQVEVGIEKIGGIGNPIAAA